MTTAPSGQAEDDAAPPSSSPPQPASSTRARRNAKAARIERGIQSGKCDRHRRVVGEDTAIDDLALAGGGPAVAVEVVDVIAGQVHEAGEVGRVAQVDVAAEDQR